MCLLTSRPLAPDSPGIPRDEAGRVLLVPYNDLDTLRAVLKAHRTEIAAVVIEPIMRGLRADPGYLEGVCTAARGLGIPVIFDEVITGFRVALGGAQEFYGVRADLTVLGKALGGGLPIGAIAGSEELMAWLDPARPNGERILAEGSFYGNPFCAAAALANLKELNRPGTYETLHRLGGLFADELDRAFRDFGLHPHFVGLGPLVEFYFGDEAPKDYAGAQRSDQSIKKTLSAGLRREGVFGGGGRYNVSLVHTEADIHFAVQAVKRVLASIH